VVNRVVPGITAEGDIPSEETRPHVYGIFFGEGMSESVVVTQRSDGSRNFFVAGKTQASSKLVDMRLQRMLGHISALTTVDNPRSVLVVACGAGVTAGTYTLYPSIQRIVICDLEKLVPKFVAPLFKKENYDVVNDPRTQIVIDDGRHYIRTTQEKFDIITSDPVDPFIKGAAALYTEEYFTVCRQHLNPGGVMALWIPFYQCSPTAIKSLFAAFFKAFPEGIIWSNEKEGKGYDAVLFGQAGPAHIDIDKIQARLNSPDYLPVAQSLREVGFPTAIDLFGTFAGYGPFLQNWLADAQINTDHTMRLQYLTGMSTGYSYEALILEQILRSYSFPDKVFRGSDKSILELKKRISREH
jgi:spermidine synthase